MRLIFVAGAVVCLSTACTCYPAAAPRRNNSKPGTSSAPSSTGTARYRDAYPEAQAQAQAEAVPQSLRTSAYCRRRQGDRRGLHGPVRYVLQPAGDPALSAALSRQARP